MLRAASLALASILAVSAALTGGTAAHAVTEAPSNTNTAVEATEAALSWGVKESFRSYMLMNPDAFGGTITLLGAATQDEGNGVFGWAGGTGTVEADGSNADLAFTGGSGVHFQSHPMETEAGGEAYALDMTFTDPHVVFTSATTAELRFNVAGFEFAGMTEIGEPYSFSDVAVADLALPAPTVVDGGYTWSNAAATLTEQGAAAFGGFYSPGEVLDPVTFSTGELPERPVEVPEPAATTTMLSASETSVELGDRVTFAAEIDPNSAGGTVEFAADGQPMGDAVVVDDGHAHLQVSDLDAGSHDVVASFTPADESAFAASVSEPVTVTVVEASGDEEPVQTDVENANLSWGVKKSFRNYIYNFTQFDGDSRLLGSTTQQEKTDAESGVFHWKSGKGSVTTQGTNVVAAELSYGKPNGMHFQSHPMETASGTEAFALDMTFTNFRIVVTSATTAELRLDASGYEFEDMTSVGDPYSFTDIVIADLELPTPTQSGSTYTWAGAAAALTDEGAVAFGGFYEAGTELDPVTFSITSDADISVKEPSSVQLQASSTKHETGSSVTFTATTTPKSIEGEVEFQVDGTQTGKPVATTSGTAQFTTKLEIGIHSVRAIFTPRGEAYGRSISNPVSVTVTQPQTGNSGESGSGTGGDQTAGSLSWGVSQAFVAYTTCNNKEAFGYSHCAKGNIDTSGVGSGYLFPQASRSSWNEQQQTGTVSYSGSVSFKGYGTTLFNVTNPSITVSSATSATLDTGNGASFGSGSYRLDLGSATKSVGSNGEVTWSNVPVHGTLSSGGAGGSGSQSIGLDSLTFTVGAASTVSYGSTSQGEGEGESEYTAADVAPATSGVTVLTDKDKIKAGGRIEIAATGFDPADEGVLVVLYDADGTGPVILADQVTANAGGAVRWQGTLPREVAEEHIITLQGSTDAGAVIEIVDDAEKAAATQAADADTLSARALADQAPHAAGIAPAGMALWEWWASAGGLVLIAGCMTLLVLRQRSAA